MEQAMTNAIDTLSTSAPAVASLSDRETSRFRVHPFSAFDAWRVAGPILQSAIDNYSTDDHSDEGLNELVAAFGHLEMQMLTAPAATLADVAMKLEAFFAGDDEWCDGRKVKDAILADVRRLSLPSGPGQ
jgi:hypothetical protein